MADNSPEEVLRQLIAMGMDPLQKRNTMGGDLTSIDRHDTYPFISPSQFDMKERTVLVTGASKGIGKAFAIAYAKAGVSNICISARTPLDEVEACIQEAAKAAGRAAPAVLKLKMELTNQQEVETAAKEVRISPTRLKRRIQSNLFLGEVYFRRPRHSHQQRRLHGIRQVIPRSQSLRLVADLASQHLRNVSRNPGLHSSSLEPQPHLSPEDLHHNYFPVGPNHVPRKFRLPDNQIRSAAIDGDAQRLIPTVHASQISWCK